MSLRDHRRLSPERIVQECNPILRWAGSKKRSLSEIAKFVPSYHGKYVELFSGSACIYFRLCGTEAVIADANPDLMQFYTVARAKPRKLYDAFASIPRTETAYYKARDRFNATTVTEEKAALFLYLNRNCFNGIYRTNLSGKFNVPFARDRVPAYQEYDEFRRSCTKLRSAEIVCSDFEKTARRQIGRGDFVYLDPPYYVPDVRTFREYSAEHFGEVDFIRLKRTLRSIDNVGAKFLLSYPDCKLARQLADHWNSFRITTFRSVAAQTSSRRRKRELLIANYDLRNPTLGAVKV